MTVKELQQRKEAKRERLAAMRYKQPELMIMTVCHRCPSCGNIRQTPISAGVKSKSTHCRVCDTRYPLTRDMHTTGLHKKVVN